MLFLSYYTNGRMTWVLALFWFCLIVHVERTESKSFAIISGAMFAYKVIANKVILENYKDKLQLI
jgi:hypothetical protein